MMYCDTDSIATRAELPVDDKTLGALKLEKKMHWAEFVAPKIYRGEGFELKRDGTWKAEAPHQGQGVLARGRARRPGTSSTRSSRAIASGSSA